MLGKTKEILKTILFVHNKDKVKSPHVPMVNGFSSDCIASLHTGASESICVDTTKTVEKENGGILNTKSVSKPISDKHENVVLNDDEAWEKFFTLQNNPSANITNKEPFARGRNKYNGRNIVGKIAEQIEKEIFKDLENNTIKSIRLKEAKRENNIVYPSARLVLNDGAKEVNVTKLLSGNICKKYNVKTITFCHPNQSEKRGACCYVNDNGERVYEIINGSYEMTLRWYTQKKECKIKINVNDDGSIKLLESNGVTEEQLRANKEVKVGKKSEAKHLHEALASQLQPEIQLKSFETVSILSSPPKVTNTKKAEILMEERARERTSDVYSR